jgi:hypothetical protein
MIKANFLFKCDNRSNKKLAARARVLKAIKDAV